MHVAVKCWMDLVEVGVGYKIESNVWTVLGELLDLLLRSLGCKTVLLLDDLGVYYVLHPMKEWKY